MSYSRYLTSPITNLAGLSAIAYGDSQYFYYIQNQFIYGRQWKDLYKSRPSQLFFDFIIDSSDFENYILSYFESNKIISINKKLLRDKFKNKSFEKVFIEKFSLFLDTNTVYDIGFVEILDKTFKDILIYKKEKSGQIAQDFNEYIINNYSSYSRLDIFVDIIVNNPNTKIYDLPDNHIITLLNSLDKIQFNSKGLNNNYVEIPISDYENDYIYRNVTDARNSNVQLNKFVRANYSNYLPDQLNSAETYNGVDTRIPIEDELDITEINNVPISSDIDRIRNFSLINKPPGLTSL